MELKQLTDPRLQPLSFTTTVCLLQFFVLEQYFIKDETKKYSILYGWCIASARDKSENKLFCSNNTILSSDEEVSLSIIKVTYYHSFQNATDLVKSLLEGKSLKTSADIVKATYGNLKFDVNFVSLPTDKNNIAIRPIIFNETNSLVNRHFFEKYSLNSPYKRASAFTLIINRLNKVSLLEGEMTENWKIRLKECLNYLSTETTLLFKDKECIRFGNIEIINTQCADVFGKQYAWYKNIKREIKSNHSTVISAREIEVTISSNPFTQGKNLLINCYITNGAQIILDEIKVAYHNPNETLTIPFNAEEEMTTVVITIWLEQKSGEYQIWFKDGGSFIRDFNINMGLISKTGNVDSAWLKLIEDSNKKSAEVVAKAREVCRVISEKTTTIGGHNLDPWVSADIDFGILIKSITHEKSNAAFFPQGWNSIKEEHGAISFLNWFKENSNKGKKVIFLDPFFDTLGLEFLARTSNLATEFTIITCTQIMSYDDDKKRKKGFLEKIFSKFTKEKETKISEPNRATRIKRFITENQSLFNDLKCKIFDLRSKGGGDKNILHDRYMLLVDEYSNIKGYHLSNSIQGATKNHPLLITVIPADIIQEVNSYLTELAKDNQTINIVQLYDSSKNEKSCNRSGKIEKPDPALLSKLEGAFEGNNKNFNTMKFDLKKFAEDLSTDSTKEFERKWITLSGFFANSSAFLEVVSIIKPLLSPQATKSLMFFLKNSINQNETYGFTKESFRGKNYLQLFQEDFETGLDFGLTIHGYIGECYGHGSWGVHYACDLLFQLDIEAYLQLVDFFVAKWEQIEKGIDLTYHPLTKLVDVYLNKLLRGLFYYNDIGLIEKVMSLHHLPLKSLGTAALVIKYYDIEKPLDFSFLTNQLRLNLDENERLITALYCYKYGNLRKKEAAKNERILLFIKDELLSNYSLGRVKLVINKLGNMNPVKIKSQVTKKILLELVAGEKMFFDEIFYLWFDEFKTRLNDKKGYFIEDGLVDITGWSYCIAEDSVQKKVIEDITKQIKQLKQIIWKPFYRSNDEWNKSFEKLLLLKGFFIIVLLYDRDNEHKINYSSTLQAIIADVELLENSYEPAHLDTALASYINQIKENYLSE